MPRLGLLAGAFNPLTTAHVALARAALSHVDEVLFVLPRAFPHKPYEGVSFEERMAMLETALAGELRFSVAGTQAGLFTDIAREVRGRYPDLTELQFICGRDAAERIVHWDYQGKTTIEEILNDFSLLVAARQGEYTPPPHLAHKIKALPVPPEYDEISASEIRRRIATNEPWKHLVPREIHEFVARLY